jgi:hypothetical protein
VAEHDIPWHRKKKFQKCQINGWEAGKEWRSVRKERRRGEVEKARRKHSN